MLKTRPGRTANFRNGYACGNSFISSRSMCYTDPESGAKLKTPFGYKEYVKRRAKVFKKAQSGQVPTKASDRRLLESVEQRQLKIQNQKKRRALVAAASAAGAKQVLPSGIAEVQVDKLNLDPKRFQYKIVAGSSGATGSLTGVKKWDSNLAGIVQAWRDPNDGNVYVVNGHNRANLAKQLGVKNITARFLQVKTPEEARAIGAMTNIAEGRGNALDSAKFFRDSGLTRSDLEKKGIPMKEKVAEDGLALSALNDGLFDKVIQGDIPTDRAIVIGATIKDKKQQSELVDLIDKQEKRGKRVNTDTIKELADMVSSAPKQQDEQGGLLGMLGYAPGQRSLAIEKAELQSDIKKRLSREKRLFGTVGKSRAAKDLKKAGNVIDIEQSREVSESADLALRVFDQEKNYTGQVSDALNRAAGRIGSGENSKKVKDEIYEEVLAELQKTQSRRKKSGTGSSQSRDQGEDFEDIGQGNLFAASAPLTKVALFSRPKTLFRRPTRRILTWD